MRNNKLIYCHFPNSVNFSRGLNYPLYLRESGMEWSPAPCLKFKLLMCVVDFVGRGFKQVEMESLPL